MPLGRSSDSCFAFARCIVSHTLTTSLPGGPMPNETPSVSVIVPVYNAQATIDRCLDALEQQTLPRARYKVIVVDDGSTDNTRQHIQGYAQVHLLQQTHAGPAAARNLGVQHARGEFVLFTDADCEPAPDWIEQMVAALNDPQIAGAKGIYRTRQRALVARFVQLEYESRYDRMNRHMARNGCIDFIDTYAAGYRRDVFQASGGFDPSFATASVEDQELSFRIAGRGHRLVFAPQAIVDHWGHATTCGAYARKKFKIGYHKVKVLTRHTGKTWTDSHTPQCLKVQIALLGLAGCALAAGLIWPRLMWAAAGLSTLFFLTTLPFAARAWKKDRAVALLSPILLSLRALALGSGLLAGIAHALVRSVARLVSRQGIDYH